MHKKTAPLFVHYGEPEKIKKSFAFNDDIFKGFEFTRFFLNIYYRWYKIDLYGFL